jgi:predicted metal-dependent phosphoesterase TrpH
MEVVDLHLHSTASDGEATPGDVVRRAAAAGVATIALTDHDTLSGLAEAVAAGDTAALRVVPGCEFAVKVWWGELHLLGYFLPPDHPELNRFLAAQREGRIARAEQIVRRLAELRVHISLESVQHHAGGESVGRPHVARAMIDAGAATSVNDAFDRYLSDKGPAYVPKPLPELEFVTALVREACGVTSAAHLKERATRKTLVRLQQAGVDAVEVLHPSHDDETVSRLRAWSAQVGLLKSGGSDWHGDHAPTDARRAIGGLRVPKHWLEGLERLHHTRTALGG